jgi:uncharacterized protein (TIGR01244 family)
MTFKTLDDTTLVSVQIAPEQVAEAAALGVTLIVNNRPDGEEPGQPASAEIEAAADAVGIAYRHLPVAGGFPPDRVAAMAEALDEAGGKVLAFCRSGTRSTFLWALANKQRGGDGATIMARAASAGYDLSPLRLYLLG